MSTPAYHPLLHGAPLGVWDAAVAILGTIIILIIILRLVFFDGKDERWRRTDRDESGRKPK
jgi:hypothetical protein